ncbi:MAG: adenine deaminase [Deferribacterales bacterium]
MKISGNIVNIERREIFPGTVTVENGKIIEISKDDAVYDRYILPPFIDSHVHVESSMLIPTEFARLASVHGTGACVSDPHEIANVLGAEGVYFMLDNAGKTPFRFYFGAPSCVPATPFETAGGRVTSEDIETMFQDSRIKYLSEMMNVPGVLFDDETVKTKIDLAKKSGRPVDGHSPMLTGDDLRKYISAGITADHEAITLFEGREKIALGMKIQIREGSAAKNFEALYPLLNESPEMCMLCSDDLHPDNLTEGHINLLVKRAVKEGVDVFNVLTAACVTPVRHYDLDCGLLNEGDSADMIVVNNLEEFRVSEVYIKGIICSGDGEPYLENIREAHMNRFEAVEKQPEDFLVRAEGALDVITVTDGQLVTGREKAEPRTKDGYALSDTERDILKIAVINRYADVPPAKAFVKNFGLKNGAFASSVAHDSHNIICVGTDDRSMARAVNIVIKNSGGLSFVSGAAEMELALPVAGLMTDADGYETAELYKNIDRAVKDAGCALSAPFMTLSFMALLVIPALKLSDKGLFDGESFSFVD